MMLLVHLRAILTNHVRKVSVWTELNILQKGVREAIPPEACYLVWQESYWQSASKPTFPAEQIPRAAACLLLTRFQYRHPPPVGRGSRFRWCCNDRLNRQVYWNRLLQPGTKRLIPLPQVACAH